MEMHKKVSPTVFTTAHANGTYCLHVIAQAANFHVWVFCLIDMLFNIRTTDWTNLPVENSTGALQVIKVLRGRAIYNWEGHEGIWESLWPVRKPSATEHYNFSNADAMTGQVISV